MLLGVVGYIVLQATRGEKTFEEKLFKVIEGWNSEAGGYRADLIDLLGAADRAVQQGDLESLRAVAGDADALGREISKLRVRISRAGVPEDPDLDQLKNHSTHWISYVVEAAENIQALPEMPPAVRRDLILQAHRLLVLADASQVWLDAYWQELHGVANRRLLDTRPLIDDVGLSEWSWTPEFADGLPKDLAPWALNGVPASKVASDALGTSVTWTEFETKAAHESEITSSVSAACAELESFARADMKVVDERLLRQAFEANRIFSNLVSPADAPADSVLSYAAAWRGTRGHHEAYMTGIIADTVGELRIRWLFKTYRLTLLAGSSWNQGLKVAESKHVPFGYVPSCTGRLEILFLSPWDVRQDLTSVIPGPRADG